MQNMRTKRRISEAHIRRVLDIWKLKRENKKPGEFVRNGMEQETSGKNRRRKTKG